MDFFFSLSVSDFIQPVAGCIALVTVERPADGDDRTNRAVVFFFFFFFFLPFFFFFFFFHFFFSLVLNRTPHILTFFLICINPKLIFPPCSPLAAGRAPAIASAAPTLEARRTPGASWPSGNGSGLARQGAVPVFTTETIDKAPTLPICIPTLTRLVKHKYKIRCLCVCVYTQPIAEPICERPPEWRWHPWHRGARAAGLCARRVPLQRVRIGDCHRARPVHHWRQPRFEAA
jgi:hypothetical protein